MNLPPPPPPPPPQSAPVAQFSAICSDLLCQFVDQSTDADNDIQLWNWSFGDGATSNIKSPTHSYNQAGVFLVLLTVTDSGGRTGQIQYSVTVTVPPPPPVTIVLTASGYVVKGGTKKVNLNWSGSIGIVNVFRRDLILKGASAGQFGPYNKITTTSNSSMTDSILVKGSGSYEYKVCSESTSSQCSNEVRVNF